MATDDGRCDAALPLSETRTCIFSIDGYAPPFRDRVPGQVVFDADQAPTGKTSRSIV